MDEGQENSRAVWSLAILERLRSRRDPERPCACTLPTFERVGHPITSADGRESPTLPGKTLKKFKRKLHHTYC